MNEIKGTGTFSLVETPTHRLLITAFHVWRELQRVKESHPDAVIATLNGQQLIGLTEIECIDGEEDVLDVVVLHAPRADYLGKSFFRIPGWPIPRVNVGEAVNVVGYAGDDREIFGDSVVVFGKSHLGLGVSSVSDRGFVLAPDLGPRSFYMKSLCHGESLALGGMSGGPVFCTRNGISHLVGFVRGGEKSDDCIFISHAAYLREDGTLDHLALPHC
jgi:hypothetical protein